MRHLTAFIIAIALGGVVTAAGKPTTETEPPPGIVEGLISGRDTSAEAAAVHLAKNSLRPPATPARSDSTMQRFDAALRHAQALLRRLASHDGTVDRDTLDAALDRLHAADLLVESEFDRLATRKFGRTAVDVSARVANARARWRQAADPLLAALREVAAADSAERAAAASKASVLIQAQAKSATPPVYGANSLPQHRPRLLPRPPTLTPNVAPSYATPQEVVPLAEDSASGSDAVLSPAVLAEANRLGNDYIAIFDFVRSQIRTQWYAGAQKGAEETLRTHAGNDIDQASLLIALLRASNAPARYVTGVVEVPVVDLATQIGVAPNRVGAALAAAGIAHIPVIAQGQIGVFRIEHTWVSTYVPFGNYRGSSADAETRSWIALMPALKPATFQAAQPVLALASLDSSAWIETFLSTSGDRLPWSALRDELGSRLAQRQPPLVLSERTAQHALNADPLQLLPASTPYPVVAVNLEAADLLDEQRQWLRLTMRTGTAADSPQAMSARWPLSSIRSHRVALGYVPASVEDQHLANTRGGLGQVPTYLIRVRPSLWVDGRPQSSGDGVLDMGSAHRIEIELSGPGGLVTADQILRAGGIAALSLDLQGDAPSLDESTDATVSDPKAARLLGRFAQRYQQEWSAADADIGAALGTTILRPLPGATLAIAQYRVDDVLGLAQALTFDGVALDALLRPVEPVSQRSETSAEADWLRVSSLHGSALEHHLFSQLWSVDALSADSGLQLAAARGIPRLRLTPSDNVDTTLPSHAASVRASIRSWLDRGHDVDIPRDPLTLEAWTGSTWRVINPATGETGYFLSGEYAGGVTVIPPGLWYFEDLAALLENPYGAEPNPDPLSGFLIQLDPLAQYQRGMAGELLPKPLVAFVSDELGRPVAGAQVAFEVKEGGGSLTADSGAGVRVVATTDASGLARAQLRLAQKQEGYGNYYFSEGQEFPQWASSNAVAVSVDTQTGALTSEVPYVASTHPAAPASVHLVKFFFPNEVLILPGLAYKSLAVYVKDEYGNEVSNQSVVVSASDTYPTLQCEGSYSGAPASGMFLPGGCDISGGAGVLAGTQCVTPSVTAVTRPFGAVVAMAPTPVPKAQILLTATSGSASGSATFRTLGENVPVSDDDNRCRTSQFFPIAQIQWYHGLKGGYGHRGNDASMEAAVSGALFPVARRSMIVRAERPDGQTWVDWRVNDTQSFTISSITGAQASPLRVTAAGAEFDLTAGATPTRVEGLFSSVAGPMPMVSAFVVNLAPPYTEPNRIVLSAFQRSTHDFFVYSPFEPASYTARNVQLEFLVDGEVVSSCGQQFVGGGFNCRPGAGTYFDPTKRHTVRYSINHGTPYYLQSAETELQFSRGVVAGFGADASNAPLPDLNSFVARRYPRRLKLHQEIDLSNQFSCDESTRFVYAIGQPATVSLRFYALNQQGERGSLEWEPIAAQSRAQGVFDVPVSLRDLPTGEYEYELRAVSLADGYEEVYVGRASSTISRRDSLSLAHSFVKGVDLFLGHAVISAEDVSVGGRGPGLSFTRTYASHSGDELTFLGRGWNSALDSQVSVDRCGVYSVTGAAGQDQRFIGNGALPDGTPNFRALHGYHGSLFKSVDGRFDFYAKDGTRYHFAGPDRRLSFVEDPNENRVTYEYDPGTLPRQVKRITDSAGRALEMVYRPVVLRECESPSGVPYRETRHLLTQVRAPLGVLIDYRYDAEGNLEQVIRSQGGVSGPKSERYGYQDFGGLLVPAPDGTGRYHHFGQRLVSARNTIDNSERRYAYRLGWSALDDPADGDPPVYEPEQRVSEVIEPDGGRTGFLYNGVRGLGPVGSTVTDARSNDTVYAFNNYGAVETVTDPAGITRTTWDLAAMQPASITDALGTVTSFTYDAHGNKQTESVVHTNGTQTRSWTWRAPELFEVPIKDRVATHTDARGIVTGTSWDPRGNLVGTSRGGVTETYGIGTYGDRASRTDGNRETTRYGYDTYGYLISEDDALGAIRGATFDALGRQLSEIDGARVITEFEYDARDRRVLTRHPADAANVRHEHRIVYNDALREQRVIDELGRVTLTTHDAMGRVRSIRNPAGDTQVVEYDRNGNALRRTDFRGNETTFVFDAANRLTQRHEPLSRSTLFTHDALGHVLSESTGRRETGDTLSDPRVTEYAYAHPSYLRTKVRRKLDDRWLETLTQYDANGNPERVTDARGKVTISEFDDRDRLDLLTQPEGRVTDVGYDGADRKNIETLSGPLLVAPQVRRWTFDQRGRERVRTDAVGKAWRSDYDAAGNLARRTDPRGHAVNLGYDARHRMILETGPVAGREITYGYDAVGNRIDEVHANGRHLQHDYDVLNRLRASRDLVGDFTPAEFSRIDYDADGNVTARRDGNGRETTVEVDALNRVFAEHRPLARNLGWTHTIHGEVLTETDAEGATTTHEIDALGRKTRTTATTPFAYQTRFDYDDAGNLTSQTNARGFITTWTYDDLNRKTTQTDPALGGGLPPYVQTWTFDAANNVVRHADRRGIPTTAVFDGENRATQQLRDGVRKVTREYDDAGNVEREIDANNNEIEHEYNAANEKTKTTRPDGVIESWDYSPNGDIERATDADGIPTDFSYDVRRRLITETRPHPTGSAITTHAYDGQGNRIATIRPLGADYRWQFGFDDANRLETVTSPTAAHTEYDYDRADRRTRVTDAEARATTTDYDELGRPTRVEFADGGAETIDDYDANSNVVTRHDANGQAITSTYDALDRLTTRNYAGAAQPADIITEAWRYTANGEPERIEQTQADANRHTTQRTWDRQSRLDEQTDRYGLLTDHEHDPQDNRTARTDQEGRTVFTPDRLNRLRGVQPATENAIAIEYTPAGRIKTQVFPNGASETYAYDTAGRIETITHHQTGVTTATLTYTYDKNGNRAQETQVSPTGTRRTTYGYDRDDRLTRTELTDEAGAITITDYTLDDVGNRRTEIARRGAATLASKTYTYNARHQLERVTDSVGGIATTYVYDDNGFMTSETTNGQVTSYRPNLQDRLATLTTPTGPPVHYAYDIDGLRVEKRTTAEATRYGYDGTNLRRETNVTNNPLATYDWAGGRVLRTRRTGLTSYAQHDALKSPIRWSRADGGEQARASYDAYGNTTQQIGVLPPIGYTGYYQDAESELLYAQQRYYAPKLGRFTRIDPWAGDTLNPITLNKYLYGNGNPLIYIDPDGRVSFLSDGEEYTRETVKHYDREIDRAVKQGAGGRAFLLGVGKGFASLGNMVVGGLNTTSNLVARNIYSGSTQAQAQREIADDEMAVTNAIETADRTATVIKEDPVGAGAAVGNAAIGFASDVAKGDPRAMAGLGEFTGQLIVPGAGAKSLKVAGESLGVARTAMRMDGSFVDAGMADDLAGMSRGAGRIPDALPHNDVLRPSLGVGDPAQRYSGPWTMRDLARAAEGKGPLDLVPRLNRRGREVPLELHHADQMPGSAIHEVDLVEHRRPGVHGQPRQGVTNEMRREDAQLHWQLRGQEMGNRPPPHE